MVSESAHFKQTRRLGPSGASRWYAADTCTDILTPYMCPSVSYGLLKS